MDIAGKHRPGNTPDLTIELTLNPETAALTQAVIADLTTVLITTDLAIHLTLNLIITMIPALTL